MLVDAGAAINMIPYSVFKKLGWEDDELMKTNMTLKGMGGNSMEARGIIFMELTVESKSLATEFFIIEVQGNYSIILGHDWIHINHCVPSTLYQFLIQWINDEIKVVHVDASAYIALATQWPIGRMGAPNGYRGMILLATSFLASQRMDLCSCLCSQLQKQGSEM
jgi:hypothetical protein